MPPPPATPPPNRPAPTAGGCLLAFAIVAGAAIGYLLGQPSVGLIAGGIAGTALAVWVWLRERQ